MVMLADACGMRLAEPAGVREELLRLMLHRLVAAGEIAERLGPALVDAWRDELAGAGVPPETLLAAARGSSRELRLWVVGERRWRPTAEYLFGRALRRAAA